MDHIYNRLVDAGCDLDNHCSDLYVLVTPKSKELVESSGEDYSVFISQTDGKPWYEIPFAYLPFWQQRNTT